MRLPGPLEYLSLAMGFAFATAPTIMGVLSIAEGNYLFGGLYLGLGVLMFVLPEYVQRQLPGPREVVRAYRPRPVAAAKRRLPGGRAGGDADDEEQSDAREIEVERTDGAGRTDTEEQSRGEE